MNVSIIAVTIPTVRALLAHLITNYGGTGGLTARETAAYSSGRSRKIGDSIPMHSLRPAISHNGMSKALDAKEYNALGLAQPIDFPSMLKSGGLLYAERVPLNATILVSLIKVPYHSVGSVLPLLLLLFMLFMLLGPDIVASGLDGGTSAGDDGDDIEPYSDCLNQAQIEGIISDSIYLLENPGVSDYNVTTKRLFTPDVQVVSDSLKVSNGFPIDGTAFFPTRKAIEEAAFSVLLPINDMTTTYYSYNCEDQTMSWRWTASGMGTGKTRIGNNMLFDLTNGRISHVYWEFNSINWVKNVGITCPVPQAS
ncbi:hypothetical protein DV735_g4840, partial [Chaetothyriales sp. CBS 134920]